MKFERNPFVIISVIGQDLLAHNDAKAATEVMSWFDEKPWIALALYFNSDAAIPFFDQYSL